MSMPGYREQYPEEDDERRLWDDWQGDMCDAEYEQFLYEQEQNTGGLTCLDMMILDFEIFEFDWD